MSSDIANEIKEKEEETGEYRFHGKPYAEYLASICKQWHEEDLEIDDDLADGAGDTEIWLAHAKADKNLQYAVKLVSISRKHVYRICNEAKALSTLNHPNILKLYGFIETEDDRLGLVLEYAEKGDLYGLFTPHKHFKPLPLERVKRYIRQLGSALACCHKHQIVHCDVKPENLLIDHEDNLKLADFGGAIWTAKELQDTFDRPEIIGTYEYMSPEVAYYMLTKNFIPNTDFVGQSDMWSVGVVIYEMCSGCMPFLGRRPRGGTRYTRKDLKLATRKTLKENARIKSWPKEFGPELSSIRTLIQQLVCVDPKKRLTAAQLVEQPCLQASVVVPLATDERKQDDTDGKKA